MNALLEGTVRHARHAPRRHAFRYGLSFVDVDLDSLDERLRQGPSWSLTKLGLIRLRRSDYLGPADVPLKQAVLDRVEAELGRRPRGRVSMLTMPRVLGYVFNPVTFYLCHDEHGALDTFVAEITNTPWKERHSYVLEAPASGRCEWTFGKDFHVSPFHSMDHTYVWSLDASGSQLGIRMQNLVEGEVVFEAGFRGDRRPLTGTGIRTALARLAFRTLRVHAAIYWHAALLWLKRVPFHVHPDKRTSLETAS